MRLLLILMLGLSLYSCKYKESPNLKEVVVTISVATDSNIFIVSPECIDTDKASSKITYNTNKINNKAGQYTAYQKDELSSSFSFNLEEGTYCISNRASYENGDWVLNTGSILEKTINVGTQKEETLNENDLLNLE